jgi:hypothetical protein
MTMVWVILCRKVMGTYVQHDSWWFANVALIIERWRRLALAGWIWGFESGGSFIALPPALYLLKRVIASQIGRNIVYFVFNNSTYFLKETHTCQALGRCSKMQITRKTMMCVCLLHIKWSSKLIDFYLRKFFISICCGQALASHWRVFWSIAEWILLVRYQCNVELPYIDHFS